MKTIQILITVPDDVEVKIGGNAGGNDRPFVARPDPEQPSSPCPVHGTGWRMIKAGVSKKTGKPFNAFWVCQTEGCDERPGRESVIEDVSGPLPF